MKTKRIISRLFYVTLFSFLMSTNFGCKAWMDAHIEGKPLLANNVIDTSINDYFTPNIAGIKAGFGLRSIEGESATKLCFGAEYYRRLFVAQEGRGAGYLGAYGTYHTENADNYNKNTFKLGPEFMYVDQLTRNGEVDLTYNLKGIYETGTIDNNGFEENVTGTGIAAGIGTQFNFNDKLSFAINAQLFSWKNQTFEFEGVEIDRSQTRIGLNKDNRVTGSLRYRF